MKFSIFQDSRIGDRHNNEDRLAYSYSRDALLMVVADGMGGHEGGEIASLITVRVLMAAFKRHATPDLPDPFLFLQKYIKDAHQSITNYASKYYLQDPPRTTLVACLIQNNIAYWAHSGDSRLYLLRNGRLFAQSRDHSRIRLLLDSGIITLEQAINHPDRNKIYSCLGGPQAPEIDYSRKTPLKMGDVIMLCTDGVWGNLPTEHIEKVLFHGELNQAVPELLRDAERLNGRGGDNLSVIAVRWGEDYVEAGNGNLSQLTTQTMGVSQVNTRLDIKSNKAGHVPLTDEEINAAIDEIRTAISSLGEEENKPSP